MSTADGNNNYLIERILTNQQLKKIIAVQRRRLTFNVIGTNLPCVQSIRKTIPLVLESHKAVPVHKSFSAN